MTDCESTRERLEEYRRGELPPDAHAMVGAHLERCAACRGLRDADDRLTALIRALPRTPAPPSLRRAVTRTRAERRGAAAWLARPWAAAALAAAGVALVLAPWVRLPGDQPADAVETLLHSGIEEHRRILLELEATPRELGDPTRLFDRVRSVTDVELPPVLAGVGQIRLLAARPTMLAERRTAAATLRSPTAPVTTYFLFSGADLPMPREHRVQIEQYKPYMRRVDEFNVIYWKQGRVAYLMVSALDEAGLRDLFLTMRKAL